MEEDRGMEGIEENCWAGVWIGIGIACIVNCLRSGLLAN